VIRAYLQKLDYISENRECRFRPIASHNYEKEDGLASTTLYMEDTATIYIIKMRSLVRMGSLASETRTYAHQSMLSDPLIH
jgi:hypothetical protein